MRALVARKVRDSRWEGEEEEVMRGVSVRSVKCRDSVGCCDGSPAMATIM